LFIALDKKESKHYSDAENIILLVHLPFYSEKFDISNLASAVRNKGYEFQELRAVWDDRSIKPLKLA